jgi:hypothetical protein
MPWRKAYKDKVTVLLCCSGDGSEKLQPLGVGKFEKICCIKRQEALSL